MEIFVYSRFIMSNLLAYFENFLNTKCPHLLRVDIKKVCFQCLYYFCRFAIFKCLRSNGTALY